MSEYAPEDAADETPQQSSEQLSQQVPSVTSKGTKPALITSVAAFAGLGLLASVQAWVHIEFVVGSAAVEGLTVTGQKLNPALTLIAMASLAAALVLMIAGKVFRRIIGVLIVLLGVGFAGLAIGTLSSPLTGASGQIGDATGITGEAQAALVSVVDLTFWPTLALIAGVALALTGVLVTVLSGRWKTAGRKYDTGSPSEVSAGKAQQAPQGDRISDWDALSDGDDPTD